MHLVHNLSLKKISCVLSFACNFFIATPGEQNAFFKITSLVLYNPVGVKFLFVLLNAFNLGMEGACGEKAVCYQWLERMQETCLSEAFTNSYYRYQCTHLIANSTAGGGGSRARNWLFQVYLAITAGCFLL